MLSARGKGTRWLQTRRGGKTRVQSEIGGLLPCEGPNWSASPKQDDRSYLFRRRRFNARRIQNVRRARSVLGSFPKPASRYWPANERSIENLKPRNPTSIPTCDSNQTYLPGSLACESVEKKFKN